MASDVTRIADNLGRVSSQISDACQRAGRDTASVRLVCVTKYAEHAWIHGLIDNGIHVLAENRPQQLVERAASFPANIEWHLVGHLQRNKVRRVLPAAALIHSVDSLRLLFRIEQIASQTGSVARVLLQVNITGEESKDGFAAEQLHGAIPELLALEHVDVAGLMTMAPFCDDPEPSRPVFSGLRDLTNELTARSDGKLELPELSMGMSSDFGVAIEEGATLIRLGRGLFTGLDRRETPTGPTSAP